MASPKRLASASGSTANKTTIGPSYTGTVATDRRRRLRGSLRLGALAVALVASALAVAAVARSFVGSGEERARVIPWLPLRARLEPLRPLASPCRAAALTPHFGLNGATGSLVLAVSLKNTSARACSLRGRPRVAPVGVNVASVHWQTKPSSVSIAEPAVLGLRLRALRPGEAALLSVWWSNWCGPNSQPASGPAPPPDAILLTLPNDGGVIRLPVTNAPRCDDPTAPSTLLVPPFVFDEQQPKPVTRLPLAARILDQKVDAANPKLHVRAIAHRGRPFRYELAVKNVSRRLFRFHSCPTYSEQFAPRGPRQTYVLNCRPVGALAPGSSAVFAMVIGVPVAAPLGANGLAWELAPQTYLPAFASASVIVRP